MMSRLELHCSTLHRTMCGLVMKRFVLISLNPVFVEIMSFGKTFRYLVSSALRVMVCKKITLLKFIKPLHPVGAGE